ncbi:MAG: class I mannose-6-phosphate isomerase [Clostridia bacterium]|nr:class I mannose-6-phosphate isomerase [Clostridia bacterium]
MLYPLKFKPVYKDYIWGGRNLEKLGRTLPEGIVAESWEIACHPDGMSYVANGELEGLSLQEAVSKYKAALVGSRLHTDSNFKFPLLIKLIDANDKLSVQVHPEDSYADLHENGELGKNEMWYILSAKPGAKLVYDVLPGVTKETFNQAVQDGNIEGCLKYIDVAPGDVINIPAGLVHAIGEGIVLAEVQQNSNTTYRVYDYDRVDKHGNKRPLHIDKALEVIDFNSCGRKEKATGLKVNLGPDSTKTYQIANKYFSVEFYDIRGKVEESSNENCFYLFVFLEGKGKINFETGSVEVAAGESVLIPASLGEYSIEGNIKALKSYVPDIEQDVVLPLEKAGYSEEEIFKNVSGLV